MHSHGCAAGFHAVLISLVSDVLQTGLTCARSQPHLQRGAKSKRLWQNHQIWPLNQERKDVSLGEWLHSVHKPQRGTEQKKKATGYAPPPETVKRMGEVDCYPGRITLNVNELNSPKERD